MNLVGEVVEVEGEEAVWHMEGRLDMAVREGIEVEDIHTNHHNHHINNQL